MGWISKPTIWFPHSKRPAIRATIRAKVEWSTCFEQRYPLVVVVVAVIGFQVPAYSFRDVDVTKTNLFGRINSIPIRANRGREREEERGKGLCVGWVVGWFGCTWILTYPDFSDFSSQAEECANHLSGRWEDAATLGIWIYMFWAEYHFGFPFYCSQFFHCRRCSNNSNIIVLLVPTSYERYENNYDADDRPEWQQENLNVSFFVLHKVLHKQQPAVQWWTGTRTKQICR